MQQQVEAFFDKQGKWQEAYGLLRDIVRQHKLLEETYKWMHPCYCFEGKNVVLIHGFKDYCALLFHKGALLKDPAGILIQQTANVQSARQIRFTDTAQIKAQATTIKAYVQAAVEIAQSGQKLALKKVSDYPVPPEFAQALKEDNALHQAFYALTQGRQKAYLFYFNQAKQSKTRMSRLEKYYTKILEGKGMDD